MSTRTTSLPCPAAPRQHQVHTSRQRPLLGCLLVPGLTTDRMPPPRIGNRALHANHTHGFSLTHTPHTPCNVCTEQLCPCGNTRRPGLAATFVRPPGGRQNRIAQSPCQIYIYIRRPCLCRVSQQRRNTQAARAITVSSEQAAALPSMRGCIRHSRVQGFWSWVGWDAATRTQGRTGNLGRPRAVT